MRVPIDSLGTVVLPRAVRDELGISGADEFEVRAADGRITMSLLDVSARIEQRDGLPVIATDEPMAPLTVDAARAAVDSVRRVTS